eukprot:18892-Heterococcus_DN1.PRE.3
MMLPTYTALRSAASQDGDTVYTCHAYLVAAAKEWHDWVVDFSKCWCCGNACYSYSSYSALKEVHAVDRFHCHGQLSAGHKNTATCIAQL